MFNLDFAFFNLIDHDKKGLASRKFFLEKLTPLFFKPRVEKLINLQELNAKGCNIMVPLGPHNFKNLNRNLQAYLVNKSLNIISEYDIHYMAVDRNLKNDLKELAHSFSLVFGDNFIKALANVMIADMLKKHEITRIIIVGETEEFPDFLEVISGYDIPLSIQNINPHQYEILAYRMLYERGCAIINSCLNPDDWGEGDLILSFGQNKLVVGLPHLSYLEFSNNRINLAPELEESLKIRGINPTINSLAPIFETCLLKKAGFYKLSAEHKEAEQLSQGKRFLQLQEIGDSLGIWDLFLDNEY